jgi:transglutaminase-like putative cysteine protease
MKLRVVHRTTYRYGEAVTTSRHEARIAPRDTHQQRTFSHHLEVTPTPSSSRRRFDYFGNRTAHFAFNEPHRVLSVEAKSIVDVHAPHVPDLTATPPWEHVRDALAADRRRDVLDAYELTFESPHVEISPTARDYAAISFSPGRPLLDAVRDLTRRVYADFVYDTRATEVSTPIDEVLAHRRGVCQDFAHVMISCLRSHGLAARYVSGYLLTHPPPGRPKLVGADASHAWIATWVPEHGWVDFDPTNDRIPTDEHVTIAYGRDFGDVTPIRGVILGGGRHVLEVAVDVDPVE